MKNYSDMGLFSYYVINLLNIFTPPPQRVPTIVVYLFQIDASKGIMLGYRQKSYQRKSISATALSV